MDGVFKFAADGTVQRRLAIIEIGPDGMQVVGGDIPLPSSQAISPEEIDAEMESEFYMDDANDFVYTPEIDDGPGPLIDALPGDDGYVIDGPMTAEPPSENSTPETPLD